MRESYYVGDGKNAWTAKVVVSGTGHAVARNYSLDDLHEGDIGLTLRLDRRRVEEMTPEQRIAAQGLAKEMCRAFLRTLGVEEIEGSGFAPGQFLLINGYLCKLERETQSGLRYRAFQERGCCLEALRFIPWTQINTITEAAESEVRDIVGHSLLHTFARSYRETSVETISFGEDAEKILSAFIAEWSEGAVEAFFVAIPELAHGSHSPFPALRILKRTLGIERVAEMAKCWKICAAAKIVLAERQTTEPTAT